MVESASEQSIKLSTSFVFEHDSRNQNLESFNQDTVITTSQKGDGKRNTNRNTNTSTQTETKI